MLRDKDVRRRLLFATLLFVSLTLLTVFFREPATGFLHSVQRGGLGVLTPVQSVAARAVEPFQEGYRWGAQLWRAQQRNEDLERELETLRGTLIQLQEAREENERLKELLEFQQAEIFPGDMEFEVARVVGRSPTRWRRWIQIDKGAADGVHLNQPVVGATPSLSDSLSGKGLVGKVVGVADHAAQVQLITDPESSVAAVILGSRAKGIVVVPEAGRLLMDYVERDQLVEPKSIVETSGFGRIFPKGIPIGIVESVGEEDVNVYKQIMIRPFVDFGTLEEVMVITSPLPVADPLDGMRTVVPSVEEEQGTG
ncbi:MAG: hypothetical protein Kow00129_11510 [Thermoleophilia bacterium]